MTEASGIMVDLYVLATPREQCLTLSFGRIEEDRLRQAEAYRFDQLPVLDENRLLGGLISTETARQIFANGEILSSKSPGLHFRQVPPQTELFELLDALTKSQAIVVHDPGETSSTGENWTALMTVSDLNKHSFRTLLYAPIVNLELSLAKLIDLYFEDPWDWIELIGVDARIRIVGLWEVTKRASVDTHPVTGCMLTDLINVVGKSTALREELGFKSKANYRNITGSLPEFRNQIMHPVRPLILYAADVGSLRANLVHVISMTESVNELCAKLHGRSPRVLRYRP